MSQRIRLHAYYVTICALITKTINKLLIKYFFKKTLIKIFSQKTHIQIQKRFVPFTTLYRRIGILQPTCLRFSYTIYSNHFPLQYTDWNIKALIDYLPQRLRTHNVHLNIFSFKFFTEYHAELHSNKFLLTLLEFSCH